MEDLNGDYFSLLVDESCDISRKEQMAIVLCVMLIERALVERFIGIIHVHDTSALCLKEAINLKQKVQVALDMGEVESGKGLNQELGLARTLPILRWVCLALLLDVLDTIVVDSNLLKKKLRQPGYLKVCQTFEIAFILHLMRDILAITNELNESLQKKEQDIANAILLVKVVKKRLQDLRNEGWDSLIENVFAFCVKYDILIPNFDEFYVNFGRSRRKVL
ncbi:hypothetical protein H5410_020136 [Solanum commersonii]|uniref:DUF4371 domain-containing protein n=1 Tax=Solanum commersonii TaxID=4109 RepID=A0A9J5ZAB7_SOLCO|nr:hypothetical protein H5410_020136 [Solanum commersonii]